MTTNFQKHHGAMLLKYAGISFISGAVNHGFFSGERSLWTAGIGMVLFVLGAWLEHRLHGADDAAPQTGLWQALVWGSLLSIGLGFFTGGLQHFPDSPARSAWVVPLGFFISVAALALSTPHRWERGTTAYVVVVGALVGLGSWGTFQWLQNNPSLSVTDGHSHGDTHTALPAVGPVAQVVSRSVPVVMDDQMRFTPSSIDVQAGETIRFVVHNTGQGTHEMVLGTDTFIREHAKAMQQGAAHDHANGSGTAAISLAAGKTGELVVTFAELGTLQMACLIPGHYESGMRGAIQVVAGTVPTPAAHDHSAHKH